MSLEAMRCEAQHVSLKHDQAYRLTPHTRITQIASAKNKLSVRRHAV